MKHKLWVNSDGQHVETNDPDNATVSFAPQGGGFVRNLPYYEFHLAFRPAFLPAFTPAYFGGDWLGHNGGFLVYPGFTNGRRWNGWACPLFTREVGLHLCDGEILTFDEEMDRFEYTPVGEVDPVFLEEIEIEVLISSSLRERVKVYDFSDLGWCWDQYADA